MQSKLSSVKVKAVIITIIITDSCIYISFDTLLSLSGTKGGSDLLAVTEHFIWNHQNVTSFLLNDQLIWIDK